MQLLRELRNDFAHTRTPKLSVTLWSMRLGTMKGKVSRSYTRKYAGDKSGSTLYDFKRIATALVWEVRRPLVEEDATVRDRILGRR